MSSFSVKFCFRVSCQIFFLLLLFAKNVCKFIVFGFDSHVKLTLKYSAKLLAFDAISILKGKKADGTKFSRVEFLSSLSFFFLFFSIYKGIWWSVFLALETFCERGVNSLRLTCTPFDLFFVPVSISHASLPLMFSRNSLQFFYKCQHPSVCHSV